MLPQNATGLVLPTVRLCLGVCAIILSLIFSIIFISEGSTGAGIISAVIFCLVTEFCKVTFTTDLTFYYQTKQADKALFSSVLVLALFGLSISAAVFYLTINPAKQETSIALSDNKTAAIETAIKDKKSQIAKCPANYITKCLKPLNSDLNSLQSEYNKLLKQSESLSEARASQMFWTKTAEYLGTTPSDLQLNFAIARAVLLDLLGLILISQYTSAKRLNANYQTAHLNTSIQTDNKDNTLLTDLKQQIENLTQQSAKKT